MNDSSSCFGVFALELVPVTHAVHPAIATPDAEALAALMAHDLATLVADAALLDFAMLGVHFDPVELLRPGWPIHAALDGLVARAPRGMSANDADDAARVFAFGSFDGRLPNPALAAEAEFADGPMRLVPWLLRGDAGVVALVSEVLEATLEDRGMAGAQTALFAQSAFGAQIEHARYFSILDLCAMMALQYEHAGLAPLWPLLECALLSPGAEAWLDAPPEPLARLNDGGVRMALLDIDGWLQAGFSPEGLDTEHLPRAFDHFCARQRQFAAVLAAHGVMVTFDHCPAGRDPREILAS
ncbi:MAG: hypothetical protein ABIQ97_05315 [Lysobacteraceae bacterium]